MKNFTKIALIVVLALVILGSIFCTISLCLGFSYDRFREDVEDGQYAFGPVDRLGDLIWNGRINWNDGGGKWSSAATDEYTFSCRGHHEDHENHGDSHVDSLDLDVYYGEVRIVENMENPEEIQVKVEYRKKNHKRKVEAYADGTVLRIREIGSKRSKNNDSTRITVSIPKTLEHENHILEEILLKQDAGEIFVDMPLMAEKIDITVNAGECQADEILSASKEFKVDVSAGEVDLKEIQASELSLKVGVGELDIDRMDADNIYIDCGIGSIDATASGREDDYDYDIMSSVGEVSIGDRSSGGFGAQQHINNGADKKMQIDCSIGTVDISFAR